MVWKILAKYVILLKCRHIVISSILSFRNYLDHQYSPILSLQVGSEEGDLDFNESGNWGTWFKKKSGKDTLRTREKRVRDDERRRQKDDVSCLPCDIKKL